MKTVTIKFNGEQTVIETSGFSGSECKHDTADLKRELGLTELDETPTRESFNKSETRNEVRRGC